MVEIREVKTKKELKKFVDFPNKMYKDVPQHIPSFYADDLHDWGPKNPARAYSESKAFLAYKDGKLVGRIGAILSHAANKKWNTNRMRFSQVDFIDDYEVSKALFDAVEKYAKEKGCNEIHGPLGFTDLDREGMLVEGFEERSLYITYYNFPYYNDHLKKLGYAKDVDWVEHKIELAAAEKLLPKITKISNFVKKHYKVHIADLRKHSDYPVYFEKVFNLVNKCYGKLYGTVDLTDEQIQLYGKKFSPLCDPRFVVFLMDEHEEMVGFCCLNLSFDEALKKSKGRLFPFGWIGLLKGLKHGKSLDCLLIAVDPKYQDLGYNAVLLEHIIKNGLKEGVVFGETGPQLELNTKVQGQWKELDPKQFKRRRCYIKSIK